MEIFHEAIVEIQSVFSEVDCKDIICVDDIQEQVLPPLLEIREHKALKENLQYLEQCDLYTYRHNIGVAILANMIAQALNMNSREREELIVAAFLHDIGKADVPESIMNKPGKLDADELHRIQLHTLYGYKILNGIEDLSLRQALVALQHHEREDGRGYPFGLVSHEINHYSKIVAVADVFHAMISRRMYKEPVPFLHVLQEMSVNAYGLLDPFITRHFIKQIMEKLLGNLVMLSNGEIGEIVRIHADDPIHPDVHIRGEMMDLRVHQSIYVERFLNKGWRDNGG